MKRITLAVGLTILMSLLAVSPAGAAVYPAGKSNFDSGAQGWTGKWSSCNPLGGTIGALCSASDEHSGSGGNPGGAISVRTDVTVNALGLFKSGGGWYSPTFKLPTGRVPTSARVSYDHLFNPGGLINLVPVVGIRASLVDLTDSRVTPIGDAVHGAGSYNTWSTLSKGVNVGLLHPGHSYQLRLEMAMSTTLLSAGVIGQADVRYDNVSLTVADTPCCGISTTPGVTIIRGPVTNTYINQTLIGLNWAAESGSGPGGSLVPLDRCTIVGTPGPDVIRGSSGNDVICGLGGRDRISGRGGRDIIDGANGNDRLKGGSGRDVILSLRGKDRASGGSASDRVGGGAGVDKLVGNGGPDRLSGGSSRDSLKGRSGRDRLRGGTGRDRLFGGNGRDRIYAKDGRRDRVSGGNGSDWASVDVFLGVVRDRVGSTEALN